MADGLRYATPLHSQPLVGRKMTRIKAFINKIISDPIKSAFVIFGIVTFIVVVLTSCWDFLSLRILPNTLIGLYSKEFWENVLVEAHGMILDLAIIGVVILYLDYRRDEKASIDKWLEDIDDFRYWVANEATFKIVGTVKRLNSKGISSINLSDCCLRDANLSGVNLRGANLRGAKLESANFRNAVLIDAKLEGSVLIHASMRGCNMGGSNIERSNCREANFSGAVLKDASLWRADFTDANARSADFRNADLKDVVFKGADLRSANFLGSRNLTTGQLLEASSLKDVKLDDHLKEAITGREPGLVGGI